ncbi:hypothetical protein [Halothece sp. PCC 7418]|uniref:hypothetical protein n=1 Tax=Halothece sp. (strain PCC 7418) TaxID=65093 RepID=UPI0012375845|nr:hypothetical protein [Halothece sp. PCC 7418]
MERAFIITLRLAAGLAVGFWGLSKLLFVNNWIGPYENAFYGSLPFNATLLVYILGIIQIAIALAIIFEFYRKPAAWLAVIFSVVNLVASIATIARPDNPILGNPAPLGIKLIWFFFNPLAITVLLISVGLMPPVSRRIESESEQVATLE